LLRGGLWMSAKTVSGFGFKVSGLAKGSNLYKVTKYKSSGFECL